VLPRGARGAGSSTGCQEQQPQEQGRVRQQQGSSLFVLPRGTHRSRLRYRGSCLAAPRRNPPGGDGAGTVSGRGNAAAHERAGRSSRAATAAFPLRLCSQACRRTGATETIMVAIKKRKKKTNFILLCGQRNSGVRERYHISSTPRSGQQYLHISQLRII